VLARNLARVGSRLTRRRWRGSRQGGDDLVEDPWNVIHEQRSSDAWWGERFTLSLGDESCDDAVPLVDQQAGEI
jgi:hypothetical protein